MHQVLSADGGRKIMLAYLRYIATYVKQSGAWLFAERNLYLEFIDTPPLGGETWPSNALQSFAAVGAFEACAAVARRLRGGDRVSSQLIRRYRHTLSGMNTARMPATHATAPPSDPGVPG